MERGRRLLFWAGIMFVFAAVSIVCLEAQGPDAMAKADDPARADIVTIDTMADFGKLELPAVAFYHDMHTDALAKQGKDCTACHKKDAKGKMSLKYDRLKDENAASVKEIYHSGCISCHTEMADLGQKTGPVDGQCRSCHTVKPLQSDRQPVKMDLSLHARHVTATGGDEKCGTCHHRHDEASKKLVYEKGKEQNCRNCHEQMPTEEVKLSFAQASHASCVPCHQKFAAEKRDSGPVRCASCHSAEAQTEIRQLKDVPRLKRGQPDVALLVARDTQGRPRADVGAVAFNHKAHETYAQDCRSCHVGKGSMDGDFFKLAGDMHLPSNTQGCVGCHKTRQQDPTCAGCHAQMKRNAAPDTASCAKCHDDSLNSLYRDGKMPERNVSEAKAAEVIAGRDLTVSTISVNEIPETVVIDSLVDKYQASRFPHRKIVLSLLKGMKDDKLAGYFHGQETLMCQGCHHRSPASTTPPGCGSCHAKPFDPATPDRPGLKAAYHGQCMSCHTAMKLEKPRNTACVECHKKK